MDIFLFSVMVLIGLAIFDLIVGVSNDAVNFLNSSIGSKVAPRHVIMIIASLGMLAGVTFSSGMMEVARKGIFHPEFFFMPELITIFLAVMLTDILLLDIFNTFGLPTSTTVSIVFELLGAAVAVSILKLYSAGDSFATIVNYINTGKALAIISGILLSVGIAFFFGVLVQSLARLAFTFDYMSRVKRYGGIWAGLSLSVIAYFILIKGAKGASFLTPEAIAWIKSNAWTILAWSFAFFAILFQLLTLFTKINIFKPIVLVGTFALAMAFAANDLVNFIGVPLAGMSAHNVASAAGDPAGVTMEALQKPVQTNTFLLLIAGSIMVVTLWISRKARTVTKTEVGLGRQEEGIEDFGSSALSRILVRMAYGVYGFATRLVPIPLKKAIARRMDPGRYRIAPSADGEAPSFDLLRASVNLMVASAIVSFATSLKLPLSTTYVTFMVAMGTSLSDQAWGRESAVYRVTGVLTVIGGWFFTALAAFTVSMVFAFAIYYLKFFAVIGLLILALISIASSYRLHTRREKEKDVVAAFSLKDIDDAQRAIESSFEQTGVFLKEISDTLDVCFEAAFLEDRHRLRNIRSETDRIAKWTNVIVSNIFETLSLLHKDDMDVAQKYSHTITALQNITGSHRDIAKRCCEHFENNHSGFIDDQKDDLRHVKVHITRLLWNTSIMLMRGKKVDYDYITNQCGKLQELVSSFDRDQVERIANGQSKTRLSILFYGLMENSLKISVETRNLLEIFKNSFGTGSEGRK